jgi:hypothetical protein
MDGIKVIQAREGQLFSSDISVATVIFLASLAIVFFVWNSVVDDIQGAESLRDMQKAVSEVAEQIVRTPGVPSNWNIYNVEAVGLASQDRLLLESDKVLGFLQLMNSSGPAYEDNKHKAGLTPYDFYFEMSHLEGGIVQIGNIEAVTGLAPSDAREVLTAVRSAIYNDEIVRVKLIMWQ